MYIPSRLYLNYHRRSKTGRGGGEKSAKLHIEEHQYLYNSSDIAITKDQGVYKKQKNKKPKKQNKKKGELGDAANEAGSCK
jgi:hypothetical protein